MLSVIRGCIGCYGRGWERFLFRFGGFMEDFVEDFCELSCRV